MPSFFQTRLVLLFLIFTWVFTPLDANIYLPLPNNYQLNPKAIWKPYQPNCPYQNCHLTFSLVSEIEEKNDERTEHNQNKHSLFSIQHFFEFTITLPIDNSIISTIDLRALFLKHFRNNFYLYIYLAESFFRE